MEKKLIFLDIDGTLTEPGSNTPPGSALMAIRQAQEEGHRVFLCSGRSYAMLSPLLEYGFDGVIASSGGYIICGNQVLFDCPMTQEQKLREIVEKDEGPTLVRSEPVAATMSFTFCSMNRETEEGGYVYGEDEALALAEKGNGFFLLNGHNIITEHGEIVVNNVGNVSSRTSFWVKDAIRRYGFDVRFSYIRTDETPAILIAKPPNATGDVKR